MSFRFRRSVKIAKGVRLNIGKKGVGLSFGRRGLRHSIHSSGRKTSTIGIPGTGLSYSKTSTSKSKRKTSSNTRSTQSNVNNLSQNETIIQQYHDHIHMITNLHQHSNEPIHWEEICKLPPPFQPENMGPHEAKAVEAYHNYSPNFLERTIKSLGDKKKKTLKLEIDQARQRDQDDYAEWKHLTRLAEQVLAGDITAYVEVIKEMDIYPDLQEQMFKYNIPNYQTIEAEFQVKTDEMVPKETLSLTKTGKISRRTMGKTKYYALVQDYVCSHALWVARNIHAYLPIENVIVHVIEHSLNPATGHYENNILLSVIFDRQTINKLNFKNLDPSDAMQNFDHHMNHLKTKGFRPVNRISI